MVAYITVLIIMKASTIRAVGVDDIGHFTIRLNGGTTTELFPMLTLPDPTAVLVPLKGAHTVLVPSTRIDFDCGMGCECPNACGYCAVFIFGFD